MDLKSEDTEIEINDSVKTKLVETTDSHTIINNNIRNNTLKHNTLHKIIEHICFASLILIILTGPYFRGLFFRTERTYYHIGIFAIALLWLIFKQITNPKKKIFTHPADIALLGLTLMYTISAIYGVDHRLAIIEAIQYWAYYTLYLIAKDIINTRQKTKWILNTMLITGTWMTFQGIASAMKIIDNIEVFKGNRLFSAFEYPNAFAAYAVAMVCISLGLLLQSKNKYIKSIYGMCGTLGIMALILTSSRGMWLMTPIVFVIYCMFQLRDKKISSLMYLGVWTVVGAVGSFWWMNHLKTTTNTYLGITIIGSILIGSILTLILSHLEIRFERIKTKAIIKYLLAIIIIGIGMLTFLLASQKPIELINETDSNHWNSVVRQVNNIDKSTKYTLTVDFEKYENKIDPWAGRVQVYTVDDEGKLSSLEYIDIKEDTKSPLKLEFETNEETKNIKIYFRNTYKNTAITYLDAVVTNEDSYLKNIAMAYKYIPESIIQRIYSINSKTHSSQARISFYKDASAAVREHFIRGIGGGGWQSIYQYYQSYRYFTTLTHNYYLQVLLEVGILGMVCLLIAQFRLIMGIYHSRKSQDFEMIWGASMGWIAIMMHSIMDFDLSISSLTMIMWILMGILAQKNSSNDLPKDRFKIKKYLKEKLNYQKIGKYIVLTFVFVSLIGSVTSGLSYRYEYLAKENIDINANQSMEDFKLAYKFNPLNEYIGKIVITYYWNIYFETRDESFKDKAQKILNTQLQISPYDIQFNRLAAEFAMQDGKWIEGLKKVDYLVDLQPKIYEAYDFQLESYLSAYFYYKLQPGMNEVAEKIINKASNIRKNIELENDLSEKSIGHDLSLISNLSKVKMYSMLDDNSENIYSKELDHKSIVSIYDCTLDLDKDEKLDGSYLWNRPKGALDYEITENGIEMRNEGSDFGRIYFTKLPLKANRKYTLKFVARGNASPGILDVYVYAPKAKEKTQGTLKEVKLQETESIYTLKFETDADIKPGNQRLYFRYRNEEKTFGEIWNWAIFED